MLFYQNFSNLIHFCNFLFDSKNSPTTTAILFVDDLDNITHSDDDELDLELG